MWFLIRCVVVLGIVFAAMPWGEQNGARPPAAQHEAHSHAGGQKPHAVQREEPPATLSHAAGEKLAAAARERCLAHPAECLSLVWSGAPSAHQR
jgi:hypothetical protein